jgi:hypothetical protein
MQAISQSLVQQRLTLIEEAQVRNNAIQSQDSYERNQQEVNAIYFNTLAQNNLEFTNDQISTLTRIATQCPMLDGNAVYEARGMYEYMNSETYFDDDDICANQSANSARVQKTSNNNVLVSPNPATESVKISYTTQSDSRQSIIFLLYSNIGQEVLRQEEAGNNTSFSINLRAIPEGMYFCKILAADGAIIATKKITIIR